jgi:hypothetical protein
MRFDRSKFWQSGLLTAVLGVVAYVIAVEDVFPNSPELQDLADSFSPMLIVISPVLVVAGIVMFVVGLASSKDEPRTAVADAELDARTREIMEAEGLGWTAAWHRARKEEPKATVSPEPEQEPRDLEHRLRELKQLHDNGLIDTEEYQRKQRTLLDGL